MGQSVGYKHINIAKRFKVVISITKKRLKRVVQNRSSKCLKSKYWSSIWFLIKKQTRVPGSSRPTFSIDWPALSHCFLPNNCGLVLV